MTRLILLTYIFNHIIYIDSYVKRKTVEEKEEEKEEEKKEKEEVTEVKI